MQKFRKKPVVIEAMQFKGNENIDHCRAWCGGMVDSPNDQHFDWNIIIHTLEGDHRANEGDWIIKGVKGEFYPCKPDIFNATYEAVTD